MLPCKRNGAIESKLWFMQLYSYYGSFVRQVPVNEFNDCRNHLKNSYNKSTTITTLWHRSTHTYTEQIVTPHRGRKRRKKWGIPYFVIRNKHFLLGHKYYPWGCIVRWICAHKLYNINTCHLTKKKTKVSIYNAR